MTQKPCKNGGVCAALSQAAQLSKRLDAVLSSGCPLHGPLSEDVRELKDDVKEVLRSNTRILVALGKLQVKSGVWGLAGGLLASIMMLGLAVVGYLLRTKT